MIANLLDTPTTQKLLAILPNEGSANIWGEEVYFRLPVTVTLEADARQVVDPGTVCFWVDGSALALPYGPTPLSIDDKCRLASKCNVLGRIEGDPRRLATVLDGEAIQVERV